MSTHKIHTKKSYNHIHWNGNIVIVTKFMSMVTEEIMKSTIFGVANGESLIHIFPWSLHCRLVLNRVISCALYNDIINMQRYMTSPYQSTYSFVLSLHKQDKRAGKRSHTVSSCVGTSTTHLSILTAVCERDPPVTGWFQHSERAIRSFNILSNVCLTRFRTNNAVPVDWRSHDVYVTSL